MIDVSIKELSEMKTELRKEFENAKRERIVLILRKGKNIIFKGIQNISLCKKIHYIGEYKEYIDTLKDTQFLSDNPKFDLIGIAHNHPHHEATPSNIDLDNWFYDILYFIYSNKTDKLEVYNKEGGKWK